MKVIRYGLYFLFFVFLIVYLVYKSPRAENFELIEEFAVLDSLDSIPQIPAAVLYDIPVDSLLIFEGTIKRNQFLGEILSEYQVTDQEIHELSQKAKKVYDVRKIEARKKYTLLYTMDSLPRAEYFIYEPTPIDYVVYRLKDSIEVSLHQKKIDTVRSYASGEIETSLWVTMTDAGADPRLIHELSEVYAWQVDFYRIQKGDKFKIIYEELIVNDEKAGTGKIIGALFNHEGNDFYAIFFDQGSGISYFDEEGQSLQKQFLKSPLRYTRISSRYTRKRYHPVLKRYKSHLGTDYAAPTGTPIRSVGDGIITEAQYSKYNGRYVKVRHNGVYTTQYLHMSKFASGIKKGKKVTQGQVIGYVGSTGLANGPHLCFRFWKNGQQVDGLRVELPPSEPVSDSLSVEYNRIKTLIVSELDSISYPELSENLAIIK